MTPTPALFSARVRASTLALSCKSSTPRRHRSPLLAPLVHAHLVSTLTGLLANRPRQMLETGSKLYDH